MKLDLYFIFFSGLALLLMGIFLAVPATPSDPIQYIGPALAPDYGFPFLDRLFLWLWLRLFSLFPFDPKFVGAYATLAQAVVTYWVASFWLSYRFGSWSIITFTFLFFGSTAWMALLTYTYPMQGLAMVLTISLVGFDLLRGRGSFAALGAGFVFAIFSKVQGVGFLSGFIYTAHASFKKNDWKILVNWALGFVIVFLLLGWFLYVDGNSLYNLTNEYLKGSAQTQVRGRATGGLPPFTKLLEQTGYTLSFFGALVILVFHRQSRLFLFALVALSQLFFLIAIYLVTNRGGPLIENYLLDAYTIGAIVFSGWVSLKCSDKYKFLKLYYLFPIVFVITLIAYVATSSETLPLLVILLVIFLAGLFFIRPRFDYPPFIILCSLFAFSLPFGVDGIERSKFSSEWVKPYYLIVEKVLETDTDYMVSVDLGYGEDDAAARIRQIIANIYDTADLHRICFNNNCPDDFKGIVITNKPEFYLNWFPIVQDFPRDSFEDFSLDFVSFNENTPDSDTLPFKNGGSRGEGMIEYHADHKVFELRPKSEATFTVDFLGVGNAIKSFRPGAVYLFKGTSTNGPQTLYVQYYHNGKWIRHYGKKSRDRHFLKLDVPPNASNFSYGWYFERVSSQQIFSFVDVFEGDNYGNFPKSGIFYWDTEVDRALKKISPLASM